MSVRDELRRIILPTMLSDRQISAIIATFTGRITGEMIKEILVIGDWLTDEDIATAIKEKLRG